MSTEKLKPLIHFLKDELLISENAVQIGLRHPEHCTQLPVILWQYGLITLEQLNHVFDWLEMG